jgi:hypothetical protein
MFKDMGTPGVGTQTHEVGVEKMGRGGSLLLVYPTCSPSSPQVATFLTLFSLFFQRKIEVLLPRITSRGKG